MIFRMGRKDIETEGEASKSLAISGGKHENAVQVSKFDMMGLDEAEYVALMGSYTLGFASDDNKGNHWAQSVGVGNGHAFWGL